MVHIITRNYLICFIGIESRENDTETLIFLKNGKNKEKDCEDIVKDLCSIHLYEY